MFQDNVPQHEINIDDSDLLTYTFIGCDFRSSLYLVNTVFVVLGCLMTVGGAVMIIGTGSVWLRIVVCPTSILTGTGSTGLHSRRGSAGLLTKTGTTGRICTGPTALGLPLSGATVPPLYRHDIPGVRPFLLCSFSHSSFFLKEGTLSTKPYHLIYQSPSSA